MSSNAGICPGHAFTSSPAAPPAPFVPGDALFNVVNTAVPYQALVGDLVVTTSNSVTTPVGPASGEYFAVKNVGALTVSIVGTVDGSASFSLHPSAAPQGEESVWFVWNAVRATWEVVSYYDPPVSNAVNIYVATTGNDANAGTIASPKLTLAGAYANLPYQQAGSLVIHLASGTYTYSPPPANVQSDLDSMIILAGDGAGQGADTGFTTVATGTVGVGSTSTAIVIQVAVVADVYQRLTIEFTSGVAIGVRRQINTNTTTVLSLNWQSENTAGNLIPANGDTFRIVRPAVVFTGTVDALGFIDGGTKANFHLVNIALTSGTATGIWQFGSNGPNLFYGVELRNQCSLTVTGQIVAGAGYNVAPTVLVRRLQDLLFTALGLAVGGKQWYGWGLTSFDSGGILVAVEAMAYFGGFVSGGASLNVNGVESVAEIFGGFVNNIFVGAPANFAARNTVASILLSNAAITARIPFDCLGRAVFDGNVSILLAGAATMGWQGRGSSTVLVSGTMTLTTTTSNQPTIFGTDASNQRFVGAVTTSTTVGSGLMLTRSANISFEGAVSLTQAAGGNVSRTSRLNATNFAMIGGSFTVNGNGTFAISGAFSLTNGTSTAAAFTVNQQGIVSFGGACTIQNINATAGADAVRCTGASLYFQNNPTITMAAASGYGVNARGGGKVLCNVQPSGVVGATADFTVGTGGGQDFADTALSASLSFVENGPAVVARAS